MSEIGDIMKNSVIERMYRDQFCMRNCDKVEVRHIANVNGISEFLVEDYVTDYEGHTTLRRCVLKIGISDPVIKNLD
jgi:hypothetical protein